MLLLLDFCSSCWISAPPPGFLLLLLNFFPESTPPTKGSSCTSCSAQSFLYNVTTVNLIYPELKFRPAPSPEAKEAAEKKLQEDLYPTLFHWIDKSGGPLLGGETANAADIMLGPWCRALQIVRPDLYEMGGEKLAKWWEAFVATVPMAEKTMSTLVEYATSCAAEKAGGGDAAAEE